MMIEICSFNKMVLVLISILSLFIVTVGEAGEISPETYITTPLNNHATNQDSLTVEYIFSANKDNPGQGALGSVSLIELLVNGEVVKSQSNPPQAKEGSGSFEIDLNIPDQILNLQTCAYQGNVEAGLKGCSEEVQVIIDKTPPEVNMIEVPSLYTNNPRPIIIVDYIDNLSGIKIDNINVQLNGEKVTEGISISERGLFYQPITNLQDGSYTLVIEVIDLADNIATSSILFTIDTHPPEPPSISIDKIKETNPGVEIGDIEGNLIITLKGSQDRVTIIGEESEPGNRITVNAPSPLVVGEVEYTSSYRVDISGIVEGKHIIKIIEIDQAGNESIAKEVEIDRVITEIIDFSDIKLQINQRELGGGNWGEKPGTVEELEEVRRRVSSLSGRYYKDRGNDVPWSTISVPLDGSWLPVIDGEVTVAHRDDINDELSQLSWWVSRYVGYDYTDVEYKVKATGAGRGTFDEAFSSAMGDEWYIEHSQVIPSWYGTRVLGTSFPLYTWDGDWYGRCDYMVTIESVRYERQVDLPETLGNLRVVSYQMGDRGFSPGNDQVTVWEDNGIGRPVDPPCVGNQIIDTENIDHWHRLILDTYALIDPPILSVEGITVTPQPPQGQTEQDLCFGGTMQFSAVATVKVTYYDGSVKRFTMPLPLTFTSTEGTNVGYIDADGSFVATAPGEGEVTASCGGITESVKVRVVKVDLKIYNGGSDLDNGEETGEQGVEVLGEDEEDVGAYLLVNWDDDDGDGYINNQGVWTREPIPDITEIPSNPDDSITIEDEDNLAKLIPTIEPLPNGGTVELEITSGLNKVKFWSSSTKGRQIILTGGKRTWDIANSTEKADFQNISQNGIWIEGVEKSSSERDVTLVLRYKDSRGQEICRDTVKVTVMMLNIGCAVYRRLDIPWYVLPGLPDYNHTGIVVRYTGKCEKLQIANPTNYQVFDMQRPYMRQTDLNTFLTEILPYYGQYSANSVTHLHRLEIIGTAKHLNSLQPPIEYPSLPPIAINWRDLDNNNQIENISHIIELRCDGLIEVCYENSGIMVWCRREGDPEGYIYYCSIMTYPLMHNDRPDYTVDPYTEMSPLAQRGAYGNTNTSFSSVPLYAPTLQP